MSLPTTEKGIRPSFETDHEFRISALTIWYKDSNHAKNQQPLFYTQNTDVAMLRVDSNDRTGSRATVDACSCSGK